MVDRQDGIYDLSFNLRASGWGKSVAAGTYIVKDGVGVFVPYPGEPGEPQFREAMFNLQDMLYPNHAIMETKFTNGSLTNFYTKKVSATYSDGMKMILDGDYGKKVPVDAAGSVKTLSYSKTGYGPYHYYYGVITVDFCKIESLVLANNPLFPLLQDGVDRYMRAFDDLANDANITMADLAVDTTSGATAKYKSPPVTMGYGVEDIMTHQEMWLEFAKVMYKPTPGPIIGSLSGLPPTPVPVIEQGTGDGSFTYTCAASRYREEGAPTNEFYETDDAKMCQLSINTLTLIAKLQDGESAPMLIKLMDYTFEPTSFIKHLRRSIMVSWMSQLRSLIDTYL